MNNNVSNFIFFMHVLLFKCMLVLEAHACLINLDLNISNI
jgi:hypothetical protein